MTAIPQASSISLPAAGLRVPSLAVPVAMGVAKHEKTVPVILLTTGFEKSFTPPHSFLTRWAAAQLYNVAYARGCLAKARRRPLHTYCITIVSEQPGIVRNAPTRRILKRGPTEQEFLEFLSILKQKEGEILEKLEFNKK